jgi:hypothetical protein
LNQRDELLGALESAWGIIANVSGGNWEEQSHEWTEAANRWRLRYHEILVLEYGKQ